MMHWHAHALDMGLVNLAISELMTQSSETWQACSGALQQQLSREEHSKASSFLHPDIKDSALQNRLEDSHVMYILCTFLSKGSYASGVLITALMGAEGYPSG